LSIIQVASNHYQMSMLQACLAIVYSVFPILFHYQYFSMSSNTEFNFFEGELHLQLMHKQYIS
jgi:hypothetical protein